MFSYNEYNKYYNKAKTILVQRYRVEHKQIMSELGYKGKEVVEKKEVKKKAKK